MNRDADVIKLDGASMQLVLERFEEEGPEEFGEALDSATFYVRYTRGEFDTQFGMLWAMAYEAYVEHRVRGQQHADPAERALAGFVAA